MDITIYNPQSITISEIKNSLSAKEKGLGYREIKIKDLSGSTLSVQVYGLVDALQIALPNTDEEPSPAA